MRALIEFLRRLAGSVRPPRTDHDLQEELRSHLELAAERETGRGHAPADAARLARVQSDGVAQTMDALRDQRGLPRLDALRADVVFGWRQIVRHPAASVTVVLSLGLAMGAALAAFRLVDAVLLKPLPVADPARLLVLTRTTVNMDQQFEDRDDFDYPTYRRYTERVGHQGQVMLLGMAARRSIVIGAGDPEHAIQQFVSGNVLATLGIQPAAGRLLGATDDTVPDGHPVAVITHDFWQRRFGGDPSVVGRTFRMGGRVYEIVGVSGRGFTGTEPGAVTDLFVPSMMNPEALKSDGWSWFRIWIRPNTGVASLNIQAALDAGFRSDQVEHAKGFAADTPKARIDQFFKERLSLLPAGAGASRIQKAFRQPLWILATLAALLVLVACANVANLLLARAMSRRVEMALRLSIGAARRRLIQLLLVESSMLAVLAAAVGALFSWWAAPFVVSMLTTPDAPIRLILDLDVRTLLTAATLTIAVTLLFGLAPAIRASAAPLLDALKEVRGQRAHRRLANALIAAQTAFCVFLLFGASLFVGTFDRLRDRPLGFVPDNLVQLVVEGGRQSTRDEWAQLAGALQELPRVESAAVTGWAPLTGNRWRSTVIVAGRSTPENAPNWMSVTPGYIGTMGMRLLEGRDLVAADRSPAKDKAGNPVPGAAIVNESFARAYFDGKSPVGQRVLVKSTNAPVEIVGLVADSLYFSVREASHPGIFVPLEPRSGATMMLRTESAAPDLLKILRAEITRLRPDMQVQLAAPFEALVTRQMIRERLLAALSTFFAGLGLVIALIGMYGVLNYAVVRERREIGLRMALGARPSHIVRLLTTRLVATVVVGAAAGLVAGVALSGVVRVLLFQIEPTDLSALAAPLAALAVASLIAVLPPAIRAIRTDPTQTIKTEG